MFKKVREKYYIKKMLALIEKYEFITEKISERLFLIKDVDGVLVEIYFNPKGFLQYLIINELIYMHRNMMVGFYGMTQM